METTGRSAFAVEVVDKIWGTEMLKTCSENGKIITD